MHSNYDLNSLMYIKFALYTNPVHLISWISRWFRCRLHIPRFYGSHLGFLAKWGNLFAKKKVLLKISKFFAFRSLKKNAKVFAFFAFIRFAKKITKNCLTKFCIDFAFFCKIHLRENAKSREIRKKISAKLFVRWKPHPLG